MLIEMGRQKGAYAEYVVGYASHTLLKPKELSWVKAAGVLENWITCASSLHPFSSLHLSIHSMRCTDVWKTRIQRTRLSSTSGNSRKASLCSCTAAHPGSVSL